MLFSRKLEHPCFQCHKCPMQNGEKGFAGFFSLKDVTQRTSQYYSRDMVMWSHWWGVPLNWPSRFPIRSVLPLRVAICEPRTAKALFEASWRDDLDVSEEVKTEQNRCLGPNTLISRRLFARYYLLTALMPMRLCSRPSPKKQKKHYGEIQLMQLSKAYVARLHLSCTTAGLEKY